MRFLAWSFTDTGWSSVQSAYREALVYSKKAIMRTARDRRHERTLDREKDGPSSSGRNHLSQPSQTEMGYVFLPPSLNPQISVPPPPILRSVLTPNAPSVQRRRCASDENKRSDRCSKTNKLINASRARAIRPHRPNARSVSSSPNPPSNPPLTESRKPWALDGSTNTLQLTQTLYDTYHHLLLSSNTLIKALERADWTDRLLILAALVLFLLVVGWILKRRVLDKVTGGIGWWFGASWRLVRMGVRGTSRKESSKDKGGTTVSKWMTGDGVTEAIAQVISSVVSTGTAGGNGGRAEITTKAVVGLVSSLVGIGAAEAISGILIESTTAPTQEEETGHSPWLASVVSHPSSESSAVDTESVPQMDESSPSRQRDEL